MPAEYVELAKFLGAILGPAGAAWWGVKYRLNGTVERVQRIESKVDDMGEHFADVRERLARLEGP